VDILISSESPAIAGDMKMKKFEIIPGVVFEIATGMGINGC
jgi:hypothetical protein